MQVKVYRVASMLFTQIEESQWGDFFLKKHSLTIMITVFLSRLKAPGKRKKSWGGGEACAWFIRWQTQWGSNQHYVGCQHQVGVRLKALHFKGSCHHFKDKHPHTRWPLSSLLSSVCYSPMHHQCCNTVLESYRAYISSLS